MLHYPLVHGRHLGGRIYKPDPRDRRYRMRAVTRMPRATGATWDIGPTLDQGSTPQCVAYSIAHWLACTPTTTIVETPAYEQALYDRAQQLDEWPGTDYDGTSVRAGFKVLREQGRLGSYVWAENEQEIWDFVAGTGPVVMGTSWYDGMFAVDAAGFLRLTGQVVGGHAWLLYGNTPEHYLMQNSWGPWGIDGSGTAKILRADLARLLHEEGEAGAGVEVVLDPTDPAPEPDQPGCLGRMLGLG